MNSSPDASGANAAHNKRYNYLQATGAALFGIGAGGLFTVLWLLLGSGNGLSPLALGIAGGPFCIFVFGGIALVVGWESQDRSAWAAPRCITRAIGLVAVAIATCFGTILPFYTIIVLGENVAVAHEIKTFQMIDTQINHDYASACDRTLAMTDAWKPDRAIGALLKESVYRQLFTDPRPAGGCLTADGLFKRMPALVAVGERELDRARWIFPKGHQAWLERNVQKIGISSRDWCMVMSKTPDSVATQRECAGKNDTARLVAPPPAIAATTTH